jgi:hypothetical protein
MLPFAVLQVHYVVKFGYIQSTRRQSLDFLDQSNISVGSAPNKREGFRRIFLKSRIILILNFLVRNEPARKVKRVAWKFIWIEVLKPLCWQWKKQNLLGTEGGRRSSPIFRRIILPTASGSEIKRSKNEAELLSFLGRLTVRRRRWRQHAPPKRQQTLPDDNVTSQRRYFNLNVCRLHRKVFIRELHMEKCAWHDTYCYMKLMQRGFQAESYDLLVRHWWWHWPLLPTERPSIRVCYLLFIYPAAGSLNLRTEE